MDAQAKAPLTFLPLTFSPADADASATHLILTMFPEWNADDLDFIRFTDGITNTLLKVVHCVNETNKETGEKTRKVVEEDSVLLRAYGKGTNVLIDRDRECQTHYSLSQHSLAPELLARFNNGLLYRFIPGRVASVEDLAVPSIFNAVARRLGQWHGTIELKALKQQSNLTGVKRRIAPGSGVPEIVEDGDTSDSASDISDDAASKSGLWNVMQKWINALPENTTEERSRKAELFTELDWLTIESGLEGAGEVVYSHCDLLNGNVIILPKEQANTQFMKFPTHLENETHITFIDYEYATPTERAFDLANHFSEWAGFECEYSYIPTISARKEFITSYLQSYQHFRGVGNADLEKEVDQLMDEVNQFRGVPGFYWGIWALIQATISQIDFDYATYAELRLKEYWDWKNLRHENKSNPADLPLRESRWASS